MSRPWRLATAATRLARGTAQLRRLPRDLFGFIQSRHEETQRSLVDLKAIVERGGPEARPALDRIARALGQALGRIERQQDDLGDIQDQLMLLHASNRDLSRAVASLAATAASPALRTPSLPGWFWHPAVAERVRAILRLLRPVQIVGHVKRRIGRAHDGGYVMVDDFEGIRVAVSCGIGEDASWDIDIAARDIVVDMYDHTLDRPPTVHAGFRFHRQRIAAREGTDGTTLAAILGRPDTNEDLLLKLDIEGDEWAALDATNGAVLDRCRQIVCEFHDLHRLAEDEFADRASRVFARLAAHFHVAHVHGNNCGGLINVGNVTLPQSLEVTFASRRSYEAVETDELFPGPLDMPNQPGRADLFLGAFRF